MISLLFTGLSCGSLIFGNPLCSVGFVVLFLVGGGGEGGLTHGDGIGIARRVTVTRGTNFDHVA